MKNSKPVAKRWATLLTVLVMLATADGRLDADPPAFPMGPGLWKLRTRSTYARLISDPRTAKFSYSGEAHVWVLEEYLVVAMENSGQLEVVAWPRCPSSLEDAASRTRLFIDPGSRARFLNSGGNNAYGPDGAPQALSHVGTLVLVECAESSDPGYTATVTREGIARVSRDYLAGYAIEVETSGGDRIACRTWDLGGGRPRLAQEEMYTGGLLPDSGVPRGLSGRAWLAGDGGARGDVFAEWTSEVLAQEALPPDTTLEEVLEGTCAGLLEVKYEEFFDRSISRIRSLRGDVAPPPRSRVGMNDDPARWVAPAVPQSITRVQPATWKAFLSRTGWFLALLTVVGAVVAVWDQVRNKQAK